jgi:hypothetical protein
MASNIINHDVFRVLTDLINYANLIGSVSLMVSD